MPPILGTNRFGERKALAVGARDLARVRSRAEPLMLSMEVGSGRVIAYGGDTWVWARAPEEGRLAHRKFWRQVIFWLSHKENDGENHVKLTLDRRRVGGGREARADGHRPRLQGCSRSPTSRYETKIEREGRTPATEPVELYNQGDEGQGAIMPPRSSASPATTRSRAIARRDGQEIGRDTARFLVYQDDRELENPSADLKLAREIADLTGGEAVTPEKLHDPLEGHRPLRLHRVREPHGIQGLGQLAVPPDLRRPPHPRMVAAQTPRLGLRRCGEKRLRSALRAGVWAFSRRSYVPELTNVESDCVCHWGWGSSHMEVLNEASGPSRSTDSTRQILRLRGQPVWCLATTPPAAFARSLQKNRPAMPEAIADLVERMLAMPDEDPPGAWEEAMRDLDAHRPHRKLFEGLY